jgi:hypothetical protein
MIGAGTVINPIIKIVTTVIILGAVYLFFVKPALDTTEDITENVTGAFPNSNELQQQIQESFQGVPNSAQLQKQIQQSFKSSGSGKINTDKLLECVQNANQDVAKLQRCTKRFGP